MIGWESDLNSWDHPSLLQVTEETVDCGLCICRRRESLREFHQKWFHRLRKLRDFKTILFSQKLSEAE
jgi:hypothetical protein